MVGLHYPARERVSAAPNSLPEPPVFARFRLILAGRKRNFIHMETSFARQTAILAPADIRRWRQELRTQRVAVVTGTYDILQPGNFLALQMTVQHADLVCVVLESDDVVAAHAGKGRPKNPLSCRAEFLSCFRPAYGSDLGGPPANPGAYLAV